MAKFALTRLKYESMVSKPWVILERLVSSDRNLREFGTDFYKTTAMKVHVDASNHGVGFSFINGLLIQKVATKNINHILPWVNYSPPYNS